ncbi:LacI family DNA-binding transcriptional regulator [Halobacillus sp. ACCC02827]|uniref:LacI family DNA-binding transcriptional regulator n=1 Tax=unclassified Halobacillus TaxID=2636472 RepID=UPI0002A51B6D|nr:MULTISPECIES: LacI family DNA-binding transcriptional regulator [unclassified Halobacillus]ELK48461.1 transcriptional regulator [Halobacillus sp. BAB-2008]WJE15081.1 LacI family DNA-binding transcriptional regulator [Halobacillus sp. ACCC02827]
MAKMSDVAKLAGVSTATVSRVLRNPEAVKPVTKAKVDQAIEQLNYEPNMLARHFRRTETNTILVLVPNIRNTVFAEIVGGIEEEASVHGYRVLLRNTNNQFGSEYGSVEHLKQRQVDGMIMLSPKMEERLMLEISNEFPIVLATAHLASSNIPFVSIDNKKSGWKATEHLIRLGHKRIACISGPLRMPLSELRYEGYRQAMIEHGLGVDERFVREGDFTYESGYEHMTSLLSQAERPTAVFAASDDMAIGAINAASAVEWKVPEDLAVVGFDNIQFASMYNPPLTTIAQPFFDMGKRAMELLLKKLNGEEVTKMEHLLSDELVIRESCGAKQQKKVVPL